jgi:rare lipoprotein A
MASESWMPAVALGLLLAGCAGEGGSGRYKVGSPYVVHGVLYEPREDFAYDSVGVASWYGAREHGRATANGETYDQDAFTAAHPTLQLPCLAEVTNLGNGRAVRLRINDRGPFVGGRILDVSRAVARALGFERSGTALVRVRVLPEESLALARAAGRSGPPTGAPDAVFVAASLPAGIPPETWRAWSVAAIGRAPDPQAVPAGRLRLGPFRDAPDAERAVVALLNAGLSDAAIERPTR